METINMKILLKLFCLLIPISCVHSSNASPEIKLSTKILKNYALQAKKENNLILSGFGTGRSNNTRQIAATFISQKNLNVAKARELIINTCEQLLEHVNSNQEIRPHLSNFPYTCKNLDMIFGFEDEKRNHIAPPYIALILVLNENVHYKTYDSESNQFIPIHKESYEDALKIVRGG